MPIGLWNDGHFISMCFKRSSDDGSTKRGVVNIGITREEDDIELIPSPELHLLFGSREPVGELVLSCRQLLLICFGVWEWFFLRVPCLCKRDKVFEPDGFHVLIVNHIKAEVEQFLVFPIL